MTTVNRWNDDSPASGTVELREYLLVLRRRKWTILLTAVLGVALGYAFAASRTPVYVSSAAVLVEPVAVDISRSQVRPDQLVNLFTEREVLRSAGLAQEVAGELGGRLNAPDLLDALSVSVVENTEVLQVEVALDDPAVARAAAQVFAEAYLAQRGAVAEQAIERRSTGLLRQIDQAQRELTEANRVVARNDRGSAAWAAAQSRRDLLTSRIEQLQIELAAVQALSSNPGELIAPASPATSSGSGSPIDVAIGLFAGLLVGIPLAFVRDRLDDRVRDRDDLEDEFRLPVLGSLPRRLRRRRRNADRVLLLEEPSGLAAESYRRLRTSFLASARPVGRSFVLTSTAPREGKSETAANLAVALARSGVRTLLVSGDIRLPRIDRLFGMPQTAGVTDVLRGETEAAKVVQHVPDVEHLHVLTSGRQATTPGELLQQPALQRLLEWATGTYDIVLVDAPTGLAVADAATYASIVDGVVLVVHAESTRRRRLEQLLHELHNAKATVLGAVIVDARRDRWSSYGPYYRAQRVTQEDGTSQAPPTNDETTGAPPSSPETPVRTQH